MEAEKIMNRGGDLMISISGVRGTIPAGLDPVSIVYFTRAFAAVTGETIVIGNDARPTGPMMRHLIIGTLIACGKRIVDIGLAPTPTVKAVVSMIEADAGIMISASHNPPEWNAFKFIDRGGYFFGKERSEELLDAMRLDANPFVDYRRFGTVHLRDGIEDHIRAVLKIIPNIEAIRNRGYRVVVDAVAGAGREAIPLLLEELGCGVERLYCDEEPNGGFPRPPEPTPSALQEFGKLTRSSRASVGFALDPDADRLVVASPTTGTISEEYTLPLALLAYAQRLKGGCVVINQSTSNLIEHVADGMGATVYRSAVGEANVVEMMIERHAFFGGEGNGGVIVPDVPSFGRDTLTGVALILSAMAARNADSIDDLMKGLPELHMEKLKGSIEGKSLNQVYADLRKKFDGEIDETDGLRIVMRDRSFVHARPSNTEPIIRIITQAPTKERLDEIVNKINVSK
jgi:phosphomannomutase